MISSDQYKILARFGSGMSIDDIAKDTGIDRDDVAETVTRVAGTNRQRAAHLAREHDTARRNTQLVSVPAAAPPAGGGNTIEQLLDAADATGVARIGKLAGKVRALVDDLRAAVAAAAQEQELRTRVEKLRAELDEAAAQLREVAGKPVARTATAPVLGGGPTSREIRAWAAANGVECDPRGVIPRRVRQAYDAAHPEKES